MFEQGMFNLDALIEEAAAAESAVRQNAQGAVNLLAVVPRVKKPSPWGKVLRIVDVARGVHWIDGVDRSGYWVSPGAQSEVYEVARNKSAHTRGGWYAEGVDAGAVIARWPDETAGALSRADAVSWDDAVAQLRRQAMEAIKFIGEEMADGTFVLQLVERFDRLTVTDVEDVPSEDGDAGVAFGAGAHESRGIDPFDSTGRDAEDWVGGDGDELDEFTAGGWSGSDYLGAGTDGAASVGGVPVESAGVRAAEPLAGAGSVVGDEAARAGTAGDDRGDSDVAGVAGNSDVSGAGPGVGAGVGGAAGGSADGDSFGADGDGADEGGADRDEHASSSGDVEGSFARVQLNGDGPALMEAVSVVRGEDYKTRELPYGPGSPRERFAWNLQAIQIVKRLDAEQRPATAEEQKQLAAFSGWGALPGVFDTHAQGWQKEAGEQLREVMTEDEWRRAEANTLNAHYTDPAIAAAMWDAVSEFGLSDGSVVLEPGCGSGTFMATAPEGVGIVGVELDPFTAKVAHYLHPNQQVRNEGFEQTVVRPSMVDGAVGNVPFGGFSLYDPTHNASRLSIHNHFIVKALAATRPGGLVAVVTSAFTMDAATSTARVEMAKLADLVGAVRLPNHTFDGAGTDVATDILVFQRREENVAVPSVDTSAWIAATTWDDGVSVNSTFVNHPQRVLGEMGVRNGRFGPQMWVNDTDSVPIAERVRERLSEQLAAANVRVPEREAGAEVALSERTPGLFQRLSSAEIPLVGALFNSKLVKGAAKLDAKIVRWTGTAFEDAGVAKKAVNETLSLLEVRDRLRQVLRTQSDTDSSPLERAEARSTLNRAYDAYVEKYGPINRFVASEKRPSSKQIDTYVARAEKAWVKFAGEGLSRDEREDLSATEQQREEWRAEALDELTQSVKRQDHLRPLRTDPTLGQLLGCEVFDEATQTAQKSALFSMDVVGTKPVERRAESIEQAVAISMDELQRVDTRRVADLIGEDVSAVEEAIVGAAFRDPDTGEFVVAAQYLAGSVREKLERAREAASEDAQFTANVSALEAVQPEWIGIDQVDLIPGVNVLSPSDYNAFALDLFRVDVAFEKNEDSGQWNLNGPQRRAFGEDVLARFATEHRNPVDLLASVMNQRPVIVRTKDPITERTVVNHVETALAAERGRAITAEFGKWIMRNSDVRERVEQEWNTKYNGYVAPRYDAIGAELALPGLSADFTPHTYQREAVARALHEPTTLLNHVVGAGKTGTMLMTAMELRRTGQARKPWLVVPNHLVEQITREATQWYPNAQVMGIPTGLSPVERQTWMARSAGQDWDLVICPQSVFKLMSVDPARQAEYINAKIEELRSAHESAKSANAKAPSVKQLAAAIERLETKLNRLVDSKDVGMTWEQTGCDYLMVDEAHHYKNLARSSDMSDLAHTGSDMASDLEMKLTVLRDFKTDLAKREGTWHEGFVPRVAVFATGTPVANSLAELWVMQKFLRPDLLEAQGTANLREWGRAFARATVANEATAGGAWKPKSRVRGFVNVPELMSTTRAFMSTVTREDVTAPLPNLLGGEPTVVTREISDHAAEYIKQLDRRANNLPADPSEDNLLKISNEGRMLSLDPRMVGLEADVDGGRLGLVAERMARIYRETANNEYVNRVGEVEPITGALQIAFLDRGIPGGGGFNMYGELKRLLEKEGIAPERVAFIHDAETDDERAELFERCREGKVNILIGSTEKMGTGVNVQKRAVAVHHIDVPWRPADIEQRDGRVIRQGNQNAQVEKLIYVTIGSFDQVMWQGQNRKATYQEQIMRGDTSMRKIEMEPDGAAFQAGTISAVASGSPLVMERAEVMQQLSRLEALETAHRQNGMRYEGQIVQKEQSNARSREIIAELVNVLPKLTNTGFVTHDGREAKNLTQGSHFITERLLSHRQELNEGQYESLPLGNIAGQQVVVGGNQHQWRVFLVETPSINVTIQPTTEAITTTNWALRLSNALERAEETIEKRQAEVALRDADISELREIAGAEVFEHADELAAVRARLADIDAQLGLESELDVVEVDTEYVWASDLEAFGADYVSNVSPFQLRLGDKVNHPNLGNGTVTGIPEEGARGQVTLQLEAGEETKAYGTMHLVGRLATAMTEFEMVVIERTELDEVTAWHNVRPGETFVFELNGRACTARKEEPEEGTRTSRFKILDGPQDVQVRGERIVGTHAGVVVKDRYTPEELEQRKQLAALPRQNELISGETVTAIYDKDGTRTELEEPILIPNAQRSYAVLREVLGDAWGHRFVTEPPEYAQTGVIENVPLTQLRSGDRVRRADIDKSIQTLDEIVTVVKPGWESRGIDTTYRRDGEGQTIEGTQSRTATCSVLQRTIASLTLSERVEAGILALPQGCEPTTLEEMNLGELFVRDEVGAPTVMRLTAKDAGSRHTGWRYAAAVEAATGERTQLGMTENVFAVDDHSVTIEQLNTLCVPGVRHVGTWPAENSGVSPDAQAVPAQTDRVRTPGL